MSELVAYQYALVRAVPRVDSGEFVNIGAVLYCQNRDFLECLTGLRPDRLRALDPDVDLDLVTAVLTGICAVCAGSAGAGLAGTGSRRARFGWLTAPRSTVIQTGPVHAGVTADPAAELHGIGRRQLTIG